MINNISLTFTVVALFFGPQSRVFAQPSLAEDSATVTTMTGSGTESVFQARQQAKLLHETIHGMLQIVHRDFFDEEESLKIPSASFEDVFEELERTQGISLRWISVNTRAMHVDHEPKTAFEKEAVKALISGQKEYAQVEPERFQFVGSIRLSSRCLKCHVPRRSNNKDRFAGLVISIPRKSPMPTAVQKSVD